MEQFEIKYIFDQLYIQAKIIKNYSGLIKKVQLHSHLSFIIQSTRMNKIVTNTFLCPLIYKRVLYHKRIKLHRSWYKFTKHASLPSNHFLLLNHFIIIYSSVSRTMLTHLSFTFDLWWFMRIILAYFEVKHESSISIVSLHKHNMYIIIRKRWYFFCYLE